MHRRRIQRDMQRLMIAAAAARGGEPALKLYRDFERHLQADGKAIAEAEPESEMPLSQADFERMMGLPQKNAEHAKKRQDEQD